MKDSKSKQETDKCSYEDYVRDPIACGYTLVEKDGEQFYSKTIKGDGYTVILERPVLTPEERKRREQEVKDTLVNVYRELYSLDPELANLLTKKTDKE